jgi:hypothetical protein
LQVICQVLQSCYRWRCPRVHHVQVKCTWCTFCSDTLLYLQYLKTKDTGRQEVEWVNNTVSIIASEWMNK